MSRYLGRGNRYPLLTSADGLIAPDAMNYRAGMARPRKVPPLVPGHPSDVPEPIPVPDVPFIPPQDNTAKPEPATEPRPLRTRAILTPDGWLCREV